MTLTKPIAIQSLVDQAFNKIIEAMIKGEIAPGSHLREDVIAQQLGISRGPLREAFGRLQGCGLIIRQPNMGAYALDFSSHDISELLPIVGVMEVMACRLAAKEISDNELDELVALVEKHDSSTAGYFSPVANQEFHEAVVRCSHNGRLIRLLCDDLYYQLRICCNRLRLDERRADFVHAQHREIVEALTAGDASAAEAAMQRHVMDEREHMVRADAHYTEPEAVL
jgi:DNA-binding GntR family transcriptional regulator